MSEARASFSGSGATPEEAIAALVAFIRTRPKWKLSGDVMIHRRPVDGVENWLAEGMFVREFDL